MTWIGKVTRYGVPILLMVGLILWTFASVTSSKNGALPKILVDPMTEDPDLALYLEALALINERAGFIEHPAPRAQMVRESIKGFLARHDASSDFLSAEEAIRFRQLQTDRFMGLGMELERTSQGEIICFPYPGSPAANAGIIPGDELEKINGVSIAKNSLLEISMVSSQENGVPLVIGIKRRDIIRDFKVIPSKMVISPISKIQSGLFTVIRLLRFTPQARLILQDLLSPIPKGPLVIDLRKNRGGDFHAAVDMAKLFLHAGDTVVSVRSRSGIKNYVAENNGIYASIPIYLWQDEQTASSAEIFIAALTDNRQARSIGRRTYGKGSKQDIIELSDGSLLLLTTGYMLTPRGVSYDRLGIDPQYLVTSDGHDDDQYVGKLNEILKQML